MAAISAAEESAHANFRRTRRFRSKETCLQENCDRRISNTRASYVAHCSVPVLVCLVLSIFIRIALWDKWRAGIPAEGSSHCLSASHLLNLFVPADIDALADAWKPLR